MTRVVVAGLGETGALTAMRLARRPELDVVGISSKPGLVSGQELGLRLARPEQWQREYRWSFDRLRGLDPVRTVHGELSGLDLDRRIVSVADQPDEPYDLLVIATGVTNGFWRTPQLQDDADVTAALDHAHQRMAAAGSILVIGGGAASVSTALQVASRWPETAVMLAFPRDRALPSHHRRTWELVSRRLAAAGVRLLPGHRALLPDDLRSVGSGPVTWTTGQPSTAADAVVWAVGRTAPNTTWLPDAVTDEAGFVRVGPTLQVPGHPEIFAIGDVAATDPLRSSARARADKLLARNIRAHLTGRPLRNFRPLDHRWGSVLGTEPDGLRIYSSTGRAFRIPAAVTHHVLQPWIVRRGIWGGVREP